MTIDITALIIASLSIISSLVLGFLQLGKIKAEAKKANTEAQADLVTVALNINKQEIETLRSINSLLKEEVTESRKRIVELESRISTKED